MNSSVWRIFCGILGYKRLKIVEENPRIISCYLIYLSFFLSLFREVYEFPLSQSDMALQTLNLHICRYDNYSRGTSVGDVFLALAELSAQGIDFTREVFLCRNIISHQEVRNKTVCVSSLLVLFSITCFIVLVNP